MDKETFIKIAESKICTICNSDVNFLKCTKCNIYNLTIFTNAYMISFDYSINESIVFSCMKSKHENVYVKFVVGLDSVNDLNIDVELPSSKEELNQLYNKIQKLLIFK